jgi:hypothetical protein
MGAWDWLDFHRKDFWEVLAHIAAVVGGLFAAFKWLHEYRETRVQRQRELAWDQAKALRELIEAIYNEPQARDALLMLDYTKREYEVKPGESVKITHQDVEQGLRTKNLAFPAPEAYVRDCFDSLFRRLEDIEYAVEIGLVREDHVSHAINYFFWRMARYRSVLQPFLDAYGYTNVLRLLDRSPHWKSALLGTAGREHARDAQT